MLSLMTFQCFLKGNIDSANIKSLWWEGLRVNSPHFTISICWTYPGRLHPRPMDLVLRTPTKTTCVFCLVGSFCCKLPGESNQKISSHPRSSPKTRNHPTHPGFCQPPLPPSFTHVLNYCHRVCWSNTSQKGKSLEIRFSTFPKFRAKYCIYHISYVSNFKPSTSI